MPGKKLMLLAAGTALAATLIYIFRGELLQLMVDLLEWIESLGAWAAPMFVTAFALAMLLFIPAAPFLIAAGAVFGLIPGLGLTLAANLIGGSASFWLARTWLRAPLMRRFRQFDAMQALDQAVRDDGLRTVMLVRMVPILPSWLINYGLGLSPARYRHYLIGITASIPSFLVYVYYGKMLGELVEVLRGDGPPKGAMYYTVLTAGLVASVVVTVILGRRMRRNMDNSPAVETPA